MQIKGYYNRHFLVGESRRLMMSASPYQAIAILAPRFYSFFQPDINDKYIYLATATPKDHTVYKVRTEEAYQIKMSARLQSGIYVLRETDRLTAYRLKTKN